LTKVVPVEEIPGFLGGTASDTPPRHPAFSYVVDLDDGCSVTPTPADDPWIPAGTIPEAFHRPDLDAATATTITVPAKGVDQAVIPVEKIGSKVQWKFQAVDYDISFGLYFSPPVPSGGAGGAEVELIKTVRIDANVCTQEGEWEAVNAGSYLLRFDNSYSRFRSKTVLYSTTVCPPRPSQPTAPAEYHGAPSTAASDAAALRQIRRSTTLSAVPRYKYPDGRRVFII
jgi:hypothetical protein